MSSSRVEAIDLRRAAARADPDVAGEVGLLNPRAPIDIDPAQPPALLLVVDTEEEFDWHAPHDRGATSVRAMRRIGRLQALADEFGICPCYVVDYPVVSREEGFAELRRFLDAGRCTIGAHLHPWVNPPHEEPVNAVNSFPGNLPAELEAAKLDALNRRIGEVFGAPAVVYKAGRYGVGRHTGAILERLGFEVNLSPTPAFDYSDEGGPSFLGHPNRPYWFGARRRLLSIPGTGAFVGLLGARGAAAYALAAKPALRRLRLPGILARARLVDRLRLSPEGYTAAELRRLTRYLLRRGTRVFTISLHSPSLAPGCTPYAPSDADVTALLDRLRGYFEFFFGELGGTATTPGALRDALASESSRPRSPPA